MEYSYLKIPPSYIKERLLDTCKKHRKKAVPLDRYPIDILYLYKRNWHKFILYSMAEQEFTFANREAEFENIFSKIIENDWNRLLLEAAAYSWLCIGEERLESVFPKETGIPSDLSYGLALRYYKPVMRITAFLSGVTYEEERECIPTDILNEARDYAIAETTTQAKGHFNEEQVFDKVMFYKV